MKQSIRTFVLSCLVLLLTTSSGAWSAAGRVEFAKGLVYAVSPAGDKQLLRKSSEVEAGQTLETGANGLVQLRFSDGSWISLAANTRFKVDEYHFSGQGDGTERGFFSLLSGGFRTVTGLIGRVNKNAYRVTTPVAVLGIRGTHYLARLCAGDCMTPQGRLDKDGLYASVIRGAIHVANDGGALDVPAGKTAYIANRLTPPAAADHMSQPLSLSSRAEEQEHEKEGVGAERVEVDLELMENTLRNLAGLAPGVENTSGFYERGDDFLAPAAGAYQAGQEVMKVDGRYVVANLSAIEGGGATDVARNSALGAIVEVEVNVSAYLDDKGAIRVISNSLGSASNGSATVNEVYNDGEMFLARWGGPGRSGGTLDAPLQGNQSIHWLLLHPYDSPLPTAGTASYNMVAATRPSSTDPLAPLGTLTAASVNVSFAGTGACGGLPCASYDLQSNIFHASGKAGIDAIGDFETGNGGTPPGVVSGSACSGAACSAYVHGFFGGHGVVQGGITLPSSLGLVYEIRDTAAARAFHGAIGLTTR